MTLHEKIIIIIKKLLYGYPLIMKKEENDMITTASPHYGYWGLSTETKPSGEDVQNGSEYTEIDTGKNFLYDKENDTWYEQPSGGGGGLPSDYEQLVYLEDSVSPHQYIDTLVCLDGTGTKVDITFSKGGTYGKFYFGARADGTLNSDIFTLCSRFASSYTQIELQYSVGTNNNQLNSGVRPAQYAICHAVAEMTSSHVSLVVDDSPKVENTADYSMQYIEHIGLWCRLDSSNNDTWTPNFGNQASSMRLYSCSISTSTDERNFVPALRKLDSKPGLYDLVNNVFYVNLGTGEFGYEKQDGTVVAPV